MTSASVLFDDFVYDGAMDYNSIAPIWTMPFEEAINGDEASTKELHSWLKKDFEMKMKIAESRLRHYRMNMALYKGIHYRSQETRAQNFRNDEGERSLRNPKIVVNFAYEMVELKTAKLSRFKPAIAFLPNNDEYDDKNNARTAKLLVDNRWYECDIEKVFDALERASYIYGEAYLKPFWDKNIGQMHPAYSKLKQLGVPLEAVDKTGEFIKDTEGKTIPIRGVIRVGDVNYKVCTPDYVFAENKKSWNEITNITETEYMHVDILKAMYPDKANLIKEYKGVRYDPESYYDRKNTSEAMLVTLYAFPTEFLPNGLIIRYTEDVILSINNFTDEFAHGKNPFIRLTDIDVPNELYARSFLQVIKQLQMHYNNLQSGIARNHGLTAVPKWMMPKGACKISALGNDATIVEYQGPVAPQLVSFNSTPPEVFGFMEKLESLISKLSGVHGISQGELPPGVEAAISMQFLDEQEAERSNNAIVKRISVIKECAKQTLSLMGQFYREDDNRLIRLLGKDNQYLVKSFKTADFATPYDVRVQNTSALPDSKALRIQSLVQLNQAFPGMFKEAQVADMLDLGAVETFRDKITIAVKAAESENESMLMGDVVTEPKPWEDLLVHYDIHMKTLQERTFKEEVPTEYQQRLIEHIMVTEMLIWQRANVNALFRQQVMTTLNQFPVFFKLDPQSAQFLAGAPALTPMQSMPNGAQLQSMQSKEAGLTQALPGEEAKPNNAYIQA